MLLENAFGNYREVLRRVTLAPVMGQFLNHVNNDRLLPNENFARELLQLFSVGTCKLAPSGKLSGGSCKPTYDNNTVRNYAYALTGWTYPKGGKTAWGCWPEGANCEYMGSDMVDAPALRDGNERKLLSDVVVPAGSNAAKALEKVLDSLMQHQNLAPFVSQRLIQQLVTSNPSGDYVQRVGQAFNFYPPDYPVAGTSLVGPEFGIHNANTALERLNYLTFLLDWNGAAPDPNVPNAIGTKVDLAGFLPMASDAAGLVDGLSNLTLGRPLASAPRNKVIEAVSWWTAQTDPATWRQNRVRAAAYLVLASPDYQVQR
jgi:hypothetical protein